MKSKRSRLILSCTSSKAERVTSCYYCVQVILSMSKVRLPWTLEEDHRHEVNQHGEYDNRCEICVTSNIISRHPRRVYSESCAFDYAGITFKEPDAMICVGGVKREREREILSKHERDSRKFVEGRGRQERGKMPTKRGQIRKIENDDLREGGHAPLRAQVSGK